MFKASAGLASPESLQASFELVIVFIWVHGLVFVIIGGGASRLLGLAEHEASRQVLREIGLGPASALS